MSVLSTPIMNTTIISSIRENPRCRRGLLGAVMGAISGSFLGRPLGGRPLAFHVGGRGAARPQANLVFMGLPHGGGARIHEYVVQPQAAGVACDGVQLGGPLLV